MPHLALFSFSPGMTPEQQLALVRGERVPRETVESVAPKPEPEAAAIIEPALEALPSKLRRRARVSRGTFRGDDPTTLVVNEAYESDREN
jgi:hypothetical protein